MKEDVLEQVVEDFLQLRGYFTIHNLRFKPDPDHADYAQKQDSVASDIDVVGYNPLLPPPDRVHVVSCKSYQVGFHPVSKLAEMRGGLVKYGRPTWKSHRELWEPKWAQAFHAAVRAATGEDQFMYSIAVAKLSGPQTQAEAEKTWATDERIATNLRGCPFTFLTMRQMWTELQAKLTKTPAPSEIGRLAQLLKAANIEA